MYLIIDEEYRLYRVDLMSGELRSQVKNGNFSVVDLLKMEGMNIDGSWSPIQEWNEDWCKTAQQDIMEAEKTTTNKQSTAVAQIADCLDSALMMFNGGCPKKGVEMVEDTVRQLRTLS